MTQLRISEAASLLGVSDDTVRRWAEQGRLSLSQDASGRQAVAGAQLASLAQELASNTYALDPAAVQQAEKLRVSADQAQRFASAAALRKQNVEPLPEPPRPAGTGSGAFTPDNLSPN